MQVTSANYTTAWELLCKRYNNKRLLIDYQLNSLFNIQQAKETESSLRFLVDHITNLRCLNSLGQPNQQWDALLIFTLTSKLDKNTLLKWEEHRKSLNDIPTLEEFKDFRIERADILGSIRNKNRSVSFTPPPTGVTSSSSKPNSTKSFTSNNQENVPFINALYVSNVIESMIALHF